MAEKKYRITHNPYKKTTKIEEYYPGASNPWKTLGSEKEPALNYILEKKESIQQICLELLNWLEGYNNRFSNCKPYEVIFNGIKQDYFEVETIGSVFATQNSGCKFTHFVQPDKFWDSSVEIQQALEKICDNVRAIYLDEKELLQKIEKCFDVIDQNLNVLILGMQNSGKSTLINALLGREILPTSDGVETAALYTIESGDADKVIIYLDDSQHMEIMVSNKGISYHPIGNELDRIVSNISQSDTIKSVKDSSEIIRTILKELNVVCRNMQDDRGILFLKEVKIQLRDFRILGNERTVCIKDFPGAGAQYLGEEHKAIVREEIETITNAVTINVINADNSTYKNVYDFISDIKNIDELKEGDIGSQIDFARSIYVLNKAEGIKNWDEKEASVRKDLPNKKVVFCCAEAGVQLTARGKRAILRKDPYGSDDAENILNLQEHALLPAEYSKTDIGALTDDMVEKLVNGSELRNTGLILCAGLIKEYADNFASVNRARCYYQAVNNMLVQLKREEEQQESEKETEKRNKEKAQNEEREALKGQCTTIVNVFKTGIKDSELQKQLRDSTETFLKEACDCATGLKGIKKGYKEQNKKIKKANKEKQKADKAATFTDTLDWRNELGNNINTTIEEQYSDIKGKVELLLTQYCEAVKDQMLENIEATNLTPEEEEEIRNIISEYEPPMINEDDYKMPESFEFSFSVGEFGKFVFSYSAWQEDRILDSVREYWTNGIIDPYSKQLSSDIKDTMDALLDHILKRLDKFAPKLITLQKQIDEKEKRLGKLREKIEQSNKQCELCERIIESGVVNV